MKILKKVKTIWSDYIAPIIVIGLIALSVILLASMPFLAAGNDSISAYEADCAKLGELRQELSELNSKCWQDSSRIKEVREEIRTIERRCKGY